MKQSYFLIQGITKIEYSSGEKIDLTTFRFIVI